MLDEELETVEEKKDLLDIAHEILEDGHIDAEEVELMRQSVMEDGAIDQEEAEMLFAINDALDEGGSMCPEYEEFFVEMITAFLLNDDISDNSLDDMEWDWLRAMVSEDGDLGSLEAKLLANIAKEASSIPADFYEFSKQFEHIEYAEDETSRLTFLSSYIGSVAKEKVRPPV